MSSQYNTVANAPITNVRTSLHADKAASNHRLPFKCRIELIDNVATYPTPEGLVLKLMPAGLMPRLSAWLIDFIIKIVAFIIISIFGAMLGEAGIGLITIGYFLISWLYPVYFEVYRNGMTPGKKSKGIYVCHDDGTPVTLQASLIRNLLRVADFLPLAFVSAALTMLLNKKSQRIGDVVAGTIVVYRNDEDVATLSKSVYGEVSIQNSIQHKANITNAELLKSPLFFYPLTLSEQQALLSFAERQPFLSQARQVEILQALNPLINTTPTLNTNSQEEQLLAVVNSRINSIRGFENNPNHLSQ